jgi:hypothetical protein
MNQPPTVVYELLRVELERLICAGDGDTTEAQHFRDEMALMWASMSGYERDAFLRGERRCQPAKSGQG